MAEQTDLHGAASANDAARITALLRGGGTRIDARDAAGRTALLIATHANAIDAARVLIAAGADVNAKDSIEDSPYLYAAAEGRLEILRLTLAAGADLKSTNRYGGTGLIPAAHHGHPAVVRELLRTTINVDHVNRLGWTALLETIILSDGGPVHVEILTMLLAAGADVNRADRDGVTPLAHARRRGYREMIALLEAKGARE
ncbi:MAG TPA: ankyrin repeat domain-containing protein [Vineibacter sp.]|nr:ankyrin repeat domain-containing protein [Vineibacter sp.]